MPPLAQRIARRPQTAAVQFPAATTPIAYPEVQVPRKTESRRMRTCDKGSEERKLPRSAAVMLAAPVCIS